MGYPTINPFFFSRFFSCCYFFRSIAYYEQVKIRVLKYSFFYCILYMFILKSKAGNYQ